VLLRSPQSHLLLLSPPLRLMLLLLLLMLRHWPLELPLLQRRRLLLRPPHPLLLPLLPPLPRSKMLVCVSQLMHRYHQRMRYLLRR
jgi:hypothetical protein